jgi:hypothetical protein
MKDDKEIYTYEKEIHKELFEIRRKILELKFRILYGLSDYGNDHSIAGGGSPQPHTNPNEPKRSMFSSVPMEELKNRSIKIIKLIP